MPRSPAHRYRYLSLFLLVVLASMGCATQPELYNDDIVRLPPQEIARWAEQQTPTILDKSEAKPSTPPKKRPIRFVDDYDLLHKPEGPRVLHYTLENGLNVLLLEDHSAPVFAYQTWFSVGSRHERPGITGIAHLFEHLMFKETTTLKAGEFDAIMESKGAETNAATWLDWTMYREELPAGNLPLVVRLEADRMEFMTLGPEQLESEREVVKNERRYRVDNDPEGTMFELLYAIAYTTHPYNWPTVGWMKDLDAISLEDCLTFFKTYYAPNNATIIVAGDFNPETALALINARYGHMKPSPLPKETTAPEPPQQTQRRRLITMPLSAPKILLGYHIPELTHDDHPTIQVLHQILLEGKSSRLYKRLVLQEEMVAQTAGWVGEFEHPGLYEILFSLKPDADTERVEQIADEELARLTQELVSDAELAKAVNQLEAAYMRNMQSMGDRAYNLGHYMTTAGDWSMLFNVTERYRAIKAEDVRDAAARYLQSSNRTVILAMPK